MTQMARYLVLSCFMMTTLTNDPTIVLNQLFIRCENSGLKLTCHNWRGSWTKRSSLVSIRTPLSSFYPSIYSFELQIWCRIYEEEEKLNSPFFSAFPSFKLDEIIQFGFLPLLPFFPFKTFFWFLLSFVVKWLVCNLPYLYLTICFIINFDVLPFCRKLWRIF